MGWGGQWKRGKGGKGTPHGLAFQGGRDTVTCAIPTDAEGTINTGGILIDGLNIRGQINCHGGVVAGYTTDYVVNGGACGMVLEIRLLKLLEKLLIVLVLVKKLILQIGRASCRERV